MTKPPDIAHFVYRDILALFNGNEEKARCVMDLLEEAAKVLENDRSL